jgi:hypothetical protein
MANMSYCRYQNTAIDLEDCASAMEEEDYSELSFQERMAADRMYEICQRYMSAYEQATGTEREY